MSPGENETLEGHDDAQHDEPTGALSFIEFWVWHNGELIPATAEELEWIREREREREAHWRLRQWQEVQLRQSSASPAQRVQAGLARTFAAWRTRWYRQQHAPADAARDKLPSHGL